MKKLHAFAYAFLLSCVALYAQLPMKQTVKVEPEQVPLTVKQAFSRDFGTVPEDGYWMVSVVRIQENARVITTPQWYSFTKRNKKEKVEVRFSPEGEVLYVKGLERKNINNGTEPVEIPAKDKLGS